MNKVCTISVGGTEVVLVPTNGTVWQAENSVAVHRVLIVDDDEDYQQSLSLALTAPGVEVLSAPSAEAGIARIKSDPSAIDLIFTDIELPGKSGFEFIRSAMTLGCLAPIVVLTAQGSVQGAVDALRLGARDYLTKPIALQQLVLTMQELLRDAPTGGRGSPASDASATGFEGMLGRSPRMLDMFDRMRRVALTQATVLVQGESGTGKELVARGIHRLSRRAAAPFVPVHTGTIAKDLVVAELFGYARGSFSGAIANTDGKFAAASSGTLFLDEIGTMDEGVQVALLRVLDSGRYTRLGESRERDADARVVAATHADVKQMVQRGIFRQDLYYRISEVSVTLPPLRERGDDIALLAEHFLVEYARKHKAPARVLSNAAIDRLMSHRWPGNVRELRHVMSEAALFSRDEVIHADQFPLGGERARVMVQTDSPMPPRELHDRAPLAQPPGPGAPQPLAANDMVSSARARFGDAIARVPDETLVIKVPIGTTVEDMEKALILRTLDVLRGNKMHAARVLGISRRCLYNKLATYGVSLTSLHDDSDPAAR